MSSLLRRNRHMLQAEQQHIDQRLADYAACGQSYWDLLLFEVFGRESQRRQEETLALRRRRVRLTRLHLLLVRARTALEDGNLDLAVKILRRTSPQLGILPDLDTAGVDHVALLGECAIGPADAGERSA